MTAALALRRMAARPEEARDALEFHEMLEEFTPRRFVTPAIVGINVLVYLLMLGSTIQGADDLLRWGTLYAPRVKDGQVWRLVTSMFVHFGFLHLFFNMLLFVAAAPAVERIVGNAGFALLYLVSGVTGNLASLGFNPGTLGGRASGAVFGVLGGVLGLMTRYHVYIHLKDIVKVAVLVVLLLFDNVIENCNRPPDRGRIDLAAHVGGFLGGLACGVVLCQRVGPSVPAGRRVRNLIVAGGGLLVGLAGVLLVPRVDDVLAEVQLFVGTDERLRTAVDPFSWRIGKPQGNPIEMADALEQTVIPDWTRACGRLGALKRVPRVYRDLVSALRDYGKLRGESWALLLEAVQLNDPNRLGRYWEKRDASEAVLLRFIQR